MGNKPPQEVFSKWGIDKVSDSGVLVVGEKGAFYSSDDYCGVYELKGVEKVTVEYEKAENKGNNDLNNMYELFRAVAAGDPKICHSNFVDRAGPLTETILLGNLAVWAAAKGGADGEMGDWGEKVEWDAKNLKVTNLASLKTPQRGRLDQAEVSGRLSAGLSGRSQFDRRSWPVLVRAAVAWLSSQRRAACRSRRLRPSEVQREQILHRPGGGVAGRERDAGGR